MASARIYEDTRQQARKHDAKHAWWAAHGVEVVSRKLDFGDYMADGSNVSVDTKRSIAELAQDVGRDHARFGREMDRAREAGHRLVVLVDAPPRYRTADDLALWTSDHCMACPVRRGGHCDPHAKGRCSRHSTAKPLQGARLASTVAAMAEHRGAAVELCAREDAARRVCELLGVEYDY